MKILLVNNNTKHIEDLGLALAGHSVEVQQYHPSLQFNAKNKDLVILSGGGGEGMEIHDFFKPGGLWYENEMRFIKDNHVPVLGICMGFEVVCRLFGSDVITASRQVRGFTPINSTSLGRQILGKDQIRQYEFHDWAVPSVDTGQLDVLAYSATGIEVVKHKSRPIFATQFHPEVSGGELQLSQLVNKLPSYLIA